MATITLARGDGCAGFARQGDALSIAHMVDPPGSGIDANAHTHEADIKHTEIIGRERKSTSKWFVRKRAAAIPARQRRRAVRRRETGGVKISHMNATKAAPQR